ncbi:MAG: selenium-binding family protein [Chloroflexota bacterium]|nr:selenium-binding family protein [Chloroflexota bacterium]
MANPDSAAILAAAGPLGARVSRLPPTNAIRATPANRACRESSFSRPARKNPPEPPRPDGLQGWVITLDADPGGGITFDPNVFVDFGDQRPLQVRLPDQARGDDGASTREGSQRRACR